MPKLLGRDWAARFAARFKTRLRDVTFTRRLGAGVNPSDPAGPPTPAGSTTWVADGASFGYRQRDVDGEAVVLGDYMVTIMRGTIALANDDAVAAVLDPSGFSALDSVLAARAAGAAGDQITVELVGDAGAAAGTIAEVGTNVRIGFLPGSTTVAQVESLVATSALVRVSSSGTGATVLGAGDAFPATALDGGADGTTTPATLAAPRPGDSITCPPPDSTTPKTARVVAVVADTEGYVTVQVRGTPR